MGLLNSEENIDVMVVTRINSSDDLILLALVVDTIDKTWTNEIHVFIPYMPYQQADRDFGDGECFSLKTISRILNSLPIKSYTVYDPHSDVTPAILNNCFVRDNSDFIKGVLEMIAIKYYGGDTGDDETPIILSPDAGAYKKIFKLAEKIGFKGAIETANKYRDTSNGELAIRLSKEDFEGKDILIIDDICIGGRTFLALADELNKRNAGRLFLAVSHGIFSNGLLELGKRFSDIFTTNSRRDEYEDLVAEVQYEQTKGKEGIGLNFGNQLFQLHVREVI